MLHQRSFIGPARLVACLAILAGVACEPWGPIPGGRLDGPEVAAPVSDWSFSDAESTIQLETRPGDPHSVTVWSVSVGGQLYVPSRDPEKKNWVKYVEADANVRVRVGERIYPARATRVSDRGEIESVVPSLIAKYELDPPDERDEMNVWLYRIESRSLETAD
jgi:hypothetical protein